MSSPDFLHNFFAVVKITTIEKVGIRSNAVGSFYVNRNTIHSPLPGCGKPLWKKLWIVWKTHGYQQLFRSVPPSLPLWKSVYRGLHNAATYARKGMLRHRFQEDPSCRNGVKKLEYCEKMLSKPCQVRITAQYFCACRTKNLFCIICPPLVILLLSHCLHPGLRRKKPCRICG